MSYTDDYQSKRANNKDDNANELNACTVRRKIEDYLDKRRFIDELGMDDFDLVTE